MGKSINFGKISVYKRFNLGTVDEFGYHNLGFISIYKGKSSYFGIVSVSDRLGLGTVDEFGYRNLGFISIYNVRIGFTSICREKSVLFRYHGHDEINIL
jgi:hypothetical protein